MSSSQPSLKEFAVQLSRNITERYPVAIANDPTRKVSPVRLTAILEETVREARKFTLERKLGWLGKSRFGNAFRWALKDAGYDSDFVEVATEAFVVYITSKEDPDAKEQGVSGR